MSKPPNILLLTFGKNKNMISRMTHQLSFITKPLTVLLTPPRTSPTGKSGIRKGGKAVALEGTSADRIPCTGEATGAGAGVGAQVAGGGALYIEECLWPIL